MAALNRATLMAVQGRMTSTLIPRGVGAVSPVAFAHQHPKHVGYLRAVIMADAMVHLLLIQTWHTAGVITRAADAYQP